MDQRPVEGCSRGRRGHPPSQQQAAASPWETLGDLAKKEMRGSIENPVGELALRISFLMLGPLTSHQLDLLRHGGAELVGRVAPVCALKRNQVLLQKHKSSIFVLATLCRQVWRLEFFSIFCPPVSKRGGKNNVCHESLPQYWAPSCHCCCFLLWWWVSLCFTLNGDTFVDRKGDDWTWRVTHYCWRLLHCNVK